MVTPINKNSRSRKRKPSSNTIPLHTARQNRRTFSQAFNGEFVASRSFKGKFQIYTGENLNWFQIVLRLKGTVIPAILPWVLLCGGYGFLVSLADRFDYLASIKQIESLPDIVLYLNIILSLLLVFRTNTAHDRFWEGRKLWGAMVNVVRNLARGIWIIIEEREVQDQRDKQANARLVAAFSVAMKRHLRRQSVNSELAPLMSLQQYQRLHEVNHVPLEIAFWLGDYLQQQYESDRLNVFQLTALHDMLDEMVDILGGCERILKTPVPLVYTITLETLLWVYFLVLPFGLVHGLTWWTGPCVAFISFLMLAINEIGSEIEEPFGCDPNDLPLDFITNTIVGNIEDLLKLVPSASTRQPYDWSKRAA